ncbi:hypothetical protein [Streptomyces mirabilis]|uniref:hypothetical protein n=1 Tax=Streptomyces mirabilis TaxID=68239 RepID=UPI002255B105|nr:hypothetical protein [Streptomyces mirabilis]MCX4615746.1 hypothetical protein [Streptomyces mirabilis]
MSARAEVHAALMRAGYGAPAADRLIGQIEGDALAREKDTRGESPQQGESTPEPPRPHALPESSFAHARQCERIGGFFRCARIGHAAAEEQRVVA